MSATGEDRVFELVATFRAFAAATMDLDALVETVARQLARLVGDACIISRAKDDGTWRDPFSAAAHSEEHAALLRDALARANTGTDTDSARTLRLGHPVLLRHLPPLELASRVDPSYAEAVRVLGATGFLSLPLEAGGKRVGVVSLLRYLPGAPPYDERDRAFVSLVADHASLAIANAHLVKRAKTFVALVENANEFIATADFQGRVLSINRAGRELVGVPQGADVRTMTLSDFHTKDALKRGPVIRETGSWEGEGVLRHQTTGEMIPTRVSSFLVREPDGEELCYATVQHDLRETKRLEAELRQAQKMEALGRLAGGVAHDFNNLLTVILSYCRLITNTLPPDGRTYRDLQQIDRAAQRAAELTRQLLAFSRRQMVEPQVVDLGAAVSQMEGMIRRLVGEDIELRMTAGDGGTVLVDIGAIEQVVMNLVVNARDAMAAGGVLTVETAAEPGFVVLTIADTGTGIDEATKAHLFEPFFTTKERGKGTGLGLSTVMGIAEQAGGHVTVASEVGHGATFRVFLPRSEARAAAATELAPPTALAPPYVGRRRILVVEDEPAVRALIGEILREAGFDVIDAPDGESALTAVAAPGDIHLLLTDVIMPRMSGPELAAKFLVARPDGRVLYMSGYTEDKLGDRLAADVELVPKPLTPDLLLRRVRAILA